MPKLSRKSKAASPTPGAEEASSQQNNPTLFLGIFLALAVAVLMFAFTASLQGKEKVYVASSSIPPYSILKPGENIIEKEVPKDSVGPNDLTVEALEADKGKQLVSRIEILNEQRVDVRATSSTSTGTLSVVQADERVVAISTTFPGSVAGAITPGTVVDVKLAEGGGTGEQGSSSLISDVKVLGLGTGAGAAEGLRPSENADEPEAEATQGEGNIVMVLAVLTEDAEALAGSPVAGVALNPRLAYDIEGNICDINECKTTRAGAADSPPSETDPLETDSSTDPDVTETETEGFGEDSPTTDDPTTQPESELPRDPIEGE